MILIAGSANLDFVTRLPHLPRPGETVLGDSYHTAPGGKGANQAVACARAGGDAAFLGALGEDPFAEPLLESLRESGVKECCVRVPAPTGAAFIRVSEQGENSIAVAAGANALLCPEHLPDLSGVSHLLLQLESPLSTVEAFARAARAAGVKVILNAAPAQALPHSLLSAVDILMVNEGELCALVGSEGTLEDQLRRALELGPEAAVVTLGEAGCLGISYSEHIKLPAHQVSVRDTTAAGDTFVGSAAVFLAEGLPLEEALQRATVAGALACTREGAQPSIPLRAEIEEALTAYLELLP